MTLSRTIRKAGFTALIGTACLAGMAAPAFAQSSGSSGAARFQAGYGNARYAVTQQSTGSTRDASGNRLIVDGIIQRGFRLFKGQRGRCVQLCRGGIFRQRRHDHRRGDRYRQ